MAIRKQARRGAFIFLTALHVFSQVLFAQAGETLFWSERRKQLTREVAQYSRLATPSTADVLQPNTFPLDSGDVSLALNRIPSASPFSNFLPIPPAYLKTCAPLLKNLQGPEGGVRKIYYPTTPGELTVIHLKDVHGHLEAQRHLGKALEKLVGAKAVDGVGLEGAFGAIDLELFRQFPRQDWVRKVAHYLLEEERISGPIFYALTGATSWPALYGIDDSAHYEAHRRALRESLAQRETALLSLERRRFEIDKRKSAVFHSALLRLDRSCIAAREGSISWSGHVQTLAGFLGAEVLGREFPILAQFVRLEGQESKVHFALVSKEQKQWEERVRQAGFGRLLYEKSSSPPVFAAPALWREICRQAGIPWSDYPNLAAALEILEGVGSLDPEAVQREGSRAEKFLFAQLAKTPEQTRLIQESRQWVLEKALVSFSLTPEEWREYQALPGKRESVLSHFRQFYVEAQARDQAMAHSLLREARRTGAKTVAVVTGGFHGAAMAEILTQAGATVLDYVPKLGSVSDEGGVRYLSRLVQEKTPLDKLVKSETLFLAAPPWARGHWLFSALLAALSNSPEVLKTLGSEGIVVATRLSPPGLWVKLKNGVVFLLKVTETEHEVKPEFSKPIKSDFWSSFIVSVRETPETLFALLSPARLRNFLGDHPWSSDRTERWAQWQVRWWGMTSFLPAGTLAGGIAGFCLAIFLGGGDAFSWFSDSLWGLWTFPMSLIGGGISGHLAAHTVYNLVNPWAPLEKNPRLRGDRILTPEDMGSLVFTFSHQKLRLAMLMDLQPNVSLEGYRGHFTSYRLKYLETGLTFQHMVPSDAIKRAKWPLLLKDVLPTPLPQRKEKLTLGDMRRNKSTSAKLFSKNGEGVTSQALLPLLDFCVIDRAYFDPTEGQGLKAEDIRLLEALERGGWIKRTRTPVSFLPTLLTPRAETPGEILDQASLWRDPSGRQLSVGELLAAFGLDLRKKHRKFLFHPRTRQPLEKDLRYRISIQHLKTLLARDPSPPQNLAQLSEALTPILFRSMSSPHLNRRLSPGEVLTGLRTLGLPGFEGLPSSSDLEELLRVGAYDLPDLWLLKGKSPEQSLALWDQLLRSVENILSQHPEAEPLLHLGLLTSIHRGWNPGFIQASEAGEELIPLRRALVEKASESSSKMKRFVPQNANPFLLNSPFSSPTTRRIGEGRGKEHYPNERYSEPIQKALVAGRFASYGFVSSERTWQRQPIDIEGSTPLSSSAGDLEIPSGEPAAGQAIFNAIEQLTAWLPPYRSVCEDPRIRVVMIEGLDRALGGPQAEPGTGSHFGFSRPAIYLDARLLEPENHEQLFECLAHELIESSVVVSTLERLPNKLMKRLLNNQGVSPFERELVGKIYYQGHRRAELSIRSRAASENTKAPLPLKDPGTFVIPAFRGRAAMSAHYVKFWEEWSEIELNEDKRAVIGDLRSLISHGEEILKLTLSMLPFDRQYQGKISKGVRDFRENVERLTLYYLHLLVSGAYHSSGDEEDFLRRLQEPASHSYLRKKVEMHGLSQDLEDASTLLTFQFLERQWKGLESLEERIQIIIRYADLIGISPEQVEWLSAVEKLKRSGGRLTWEHVRSEMADSGGNAHRESWEALKRKVSLYLSLEDEPEPLAYTVIQETSKEQSSLPEPTKEGGIILRGYPVFFIPRDFNKGIWAAHGEEIVSALDHALSDPQGKYYNAPLTRVHKLKIGNKFRCPFVVQEGRIFLLALVSRSEISDRHGGYKVSFVNRLISNMQPEFLSRAQTLTAQTRAPLSGFLQGTPVFSLLLLDPSTAWPLSGGGGWEFMFPILLLGGWVLLNAKGVMGRFQNVFSQERSFLSNLLQRGSVAASLSGRFEGDDQASSRRSSLGDVMKRSFSKMKPFSTSV